MVLRVIARLNVGGPALHVTYLTRGLAERGYETTLVAGDVARGEESMAFPPSVTIKDYLWGGRGGYLNPIRGGQPARFPTIIQIVPPPGGTNP